MLCKNSKHTLAGWLKYLFMKLLLMKSSNIYYVRAFLASFCQVTAIRTFPKRFSKALADFMQPRFYAPLDTE